MSFYSMYGESEASYLGTGGLEGDAHLLGKGKPFLAGYYTRATPTLINQELCIYQVHAGLLLFVYEVYQNGVSLPSGGDVGDHIWTWEPTQDEIRRCVYVTDLAHGLIRLAANPLGALILVDARSDIEVEVKLRE